MRNLGHRIIIIGPICSGKSTLAQALADRRGVSPVFLDRLMWRVDRDGHPLPDDDFRREVAFIASQPRWVIEGVYPSALVEALTLADTIIHLDFNRWFCLGRYVRRCWREWLGVATQIGRSDASPTTFKFGVMQWILFTHYHEYDPQIRSLLKGVTSSRVIHVTDVRQADALLAA